MSLLNMCLLIGGGLLAADIPKAIFMKAKVTLHIVTCECGTL